MKKKTKIAQISTLVITLLLTAFPVRADDLAAPVPASAISRKSLCSVAARR